MTELDVRSDSEGTSLGVHVKPRAKENRILGVRDGLLEVAVAASPVEGEANRELVRFLARVVGVRRASVLLLTGDKGRRKVLRFLGIGPDRLLLALGIDQS